MAAALAEEALAVDAEAALAVEDPEAFITTITDLCFTEASDREDIITAVADALEDLPVR